LDQQSNSWRSVLETLPTELDDIASRQEGQITADERSIIGSASDSVKVMLHDTVEYTSLSTQQAIAALGAEERCTADFAVSRVATSLKHLASELAGWLPNRGAALSEPAPSVCQVVPNVLEMHAGKGDTWTIATPTGPVVGIFGADFSNKHLPNIMVDDGGGGQRLANAHAQLVTRYQINLDLSTEDFHGLRAGASLNVNWQAGGPDNDTITLRTVVPAKLALTAVTASPAAPRAGMDGVVVTATVQNSGGEPARVGLRWTPGPNQPLQSLPDFTLDPGQSAIRSFRQYVYPAAGPFAGQVSLDDGSSAYPVPITVVSVPVVKQYTLSGAATKGPGDGGPGGAHPYDIRCGPGEVATAIRGRSGLSIDSMVLWCSPLGTDGVIGGSAPAPPPATAVGGTAGMNYYELNCPIGSQLVELVGRYGNVIDQMHAVCIRPDDPNPNDPNLIQAATTGSNGGDQEYQYDVSCPKGTVITGLYGNYGDQIDHLGLDCTPLFVRNLTGQ
jgi:hypothetical protein